MGGNAHLPPIRGKSAFFRLADQGGAGLEILAALYLVGVRRIVAEPVSGESAEAAVGVLADRVRRLNALVVSRGLRRVVLRQADRDELAAWRRELARETAPSAGRRGFLTGLARPVSEAIDDDPPETPPLSHLQAMEAERPGVLFAHVPQIDTARCTGCDACVNACPEDALILLKDEPGGLCYHVEAWKCSRCGLCCELCEFDAIDVVEMAEQPDDVLLQTFICCSCGVEVHEPVGHATGEGLCRICRNTDHHSKLFQVLT